MAIRNIAHDMGIALGSAAHIVKLERVKQGEWGLDRAIDWDIFQKVAKSSESDQSPELGDGWRAWEKQVMEKWEVIEEDNKMGTQSGRKSATEQKDAKES